MTVIGVTGGVGTGKSTVAGELARLGAEVLDADRMSHELMNPGTPVWRKIRSAFGEGVLGPGRRIDRAKLGALVFKHPLSLRRLCRIVHPAVRKEIRQRLQRLRRVRPRAVVALDVPLLIEAGPAYPVDVLVVVKAPLRVVAQRLHKRSGWSLRDLKRRQRMQLPLREKVRRADFVVENDGSIASTRRQVAGIWRQVIEKRRSRDAGPSWTEA